VQAYPVSVKGVVARDGRVLLLHNERGEWELPGGRLEVGETPQQCVVREIAEETGWSVTAGSILDAWLYHVAQAGQHVFIVTYGCHLGLQDLDRHLARGPRPRHRGLLVRAASCSTSCGDPSPRPPSRPSAAGASARTPPTSSTSRSALAGADATLPSALLRSRKITVAGSGAGSVAAADIKAQIPAYIQPIADGSVQVPFRTFPLSEAGAWTASAESGPRVVLVRD
jgi:ADP-ribose pyrophosphatase YjhB (NUDIX family)